MEVKPLDRILGLLFFVVSLALLTYVTNGLDQTESYSFMLVILTVVAGTLGIVIATFPNHRPTPIDIKEVTKQ